MSSDHTRHLCLAELVLFLAQNWIEEGGCGEWGAGVERTASN